MPETIDLAKVSEYEPNFDKRQIFMTFFNNCFKRLYTTNNEEEFSHKMRFCI